MNLLSVSKLTDNGAEVLFNNDKAEVRKEGNLIMEAYKRDGLYML